MKETKRLGAFGLFFLSRWLKHGLGSSRKVFIFFFSPILCLVCYPVFGGFSGYKQKLKTLIKKRVLTVVLGKKKKSKTLLEAHTKEQTHLPLFILLLGPARVDFRGPAKWVQPFWSDFTVYVSPRMNNTRDPSLLCSRFFYCIKHKKGGGCEGTDYFNETMGGPILLSSKKIASQARNIANKHRALPPKSLQQGPDLVTFVRENVVNMKKAHREEFKLYSKDALEVLTQYTRLRIAQGREVGKQMKMLTQHVVSSGYRIEEVCRAVSVLERYRCRDSTLLDLISDTVIKDQREVKKTTTPSHELVYVAFKLHHMGLRGTFLSDLYTQLRKRGAWESGFDLKDCQTFLFLAGQQTPPLGMCRAIFDRVVAVMSLGTPFRPKSGAQQHRHEVDTVSTPLVHIMYNLGYVKSGEVKGDLAYMMPILCNFALSSEPNVAEVVRMVRALGRAKISFEVVPELPTLLLGLSEDALCKLTVSDQAGLLQNLTSMLRNGLTENVRGGIPPVAERLGLLPMVEVLLGELSSVESV